jgi:hypothetical protein
MACTIPSGALEGTVASEVYIPDLSHVPIDRGHKE